MARAFTISGRIEADAQSLVAAAREGAAALAELGVAARAVNEAASTQAGAGAAALEEQGAAGRASIEWLAPARLELEAWGQGVVDASGRAVVAFERQAEAGKGAVEIIAPAQQEIIELGRRSVDASAASAAALERQAETGRAAVEWIRPAEAATADLAKAAGEAASATQRQAEANERAQQSSGEDAASRYAAAARGAAGATGSWASGLLSLARTALPPALAGIGLGISAAKSYQDSVAGLDLALAVHGDRIGLTGEAWLGLARDIAAASETSQREGRMIAAAMVEGGVASEEAFRLAGETVKGYALATGQDMKAAAGEIARMMREPGAAAYEMARAYGVLDAAQVRHIESLDRSGRLAEAQIELARAMNGRFGDLAETTGWFSRQLEWAANSAANLWDNLGGWLAGGAASDPMAGLDARIAGIRSRLSGMGWSDDGPGTGRSAISNPAAIAGLESELGLLLSVKGAVEAVGGAVRDRAEADRVANERRREGLEIEALRRKYDGRRLELAALDDDEKRVRTQLGREGLSAEDRATAEAMLVAIAERRLRLNEQIDRQGTNAAGRETARLTERLMLQRQDLGLLEEIVDARARGDEALARSLQGQRDAAKAGFDLTSAAGREMAEMKMRADQLADALKTMDEIEQRMAQLNPDVTPSAGKWKLEFDLESARRWRDEQLANLDAAKIGFSEFAARVEMIFRDMVATAYEEDLRRRTDWLAGIRRGMLDLDRQNRDFAATAERGLKNMSAEGEAAWMRLVRTGKASLNDILTAFVDTMARMQWQQMIAPGFNQMASSALSWGMGLLGLGGGGGGSSFKAWVPGLHTGGLFGVDAPTFQRDMSLAAWTGAPRYHVGGMFQPGEGPAILKNGEGVFTPRQMDDADRLIAAIANRPIVINLDRDGEGVWGAAAQRAPFEIHLHAAQGGEVRQERGQGAGGGERLDVFWSQAESFMAQRLAAGSGPIHTVLTTLFGATRRPQ